MAVIKKTCALAVLALALALPAFALDVNDVKILVQNGVQDDVIINMVQNNGLTTTPTTQDIIDLNNLGASSTLMSYLSSHTSPSVVAAPPAIVTTSPTYVVPQQEIIVTRPAPTYYYNYGYYGNPYRYYRPGPSFSFSFGGGPRWGHHRPGWGRPGPGWGGPRPGGHRPGGPRPGGPGRPGPRPHR